VPYFLAVLGTTRGAVGKEAEGKRPLTEVLDVGRAKRRALVTRHSCIGFLADGNGATAEAWFSARSHPPASRAQSFWKLRATISLVRLWANQWKGAEASNFSFRFMTDSPRASMPPTSGVPRHRSTNSPDSGLSIGPTCQREYDWLWKEGIAHSPRLRTALPRLKPICSDRAVLASGGSTRRR
jgi:hypothetical protein